MAVEMTSTHPLQIIAEIHPQHGGNPGVMREMIRSAKVCGADVVKVQLYDARNLLGEDWSYLEISRKQFEMLLEWCDQEGIELMASVFDHERLQWLRDLAIRRHKIASRTVIDNPALCEAILSDGKETLVSLGMWTGTGVPFPNAPHVHHLYCKSKYPALWEHLDDFPKIFSEETFAGYSDHTLGLDFCYLAVARGARFLEKHFTLDKSRERTTEKAHICSMTPDELSELKKIGSSMNRALVFNNQLKNQ